MSTVEEIETAVQQLSRDQLAAFRNWFDEYDARQWDREMEEDVASGRLNFLIEEARKEIREGRCTDL